MTKLLSAHPEAEKARNPQAAGVVLIALAGLLILSGFEGWLPGAIFELILAVVFAVSGWWNLRRAVDAKHGP